MSDKNLENETTMNCHRRWLIPKQTAGLKRACVNFVVLSWTWKSRWRHRGSTYVLLYEWKTPDLKVDNCKWPVMTFLEVTSLKFVYVLCFWKPINLLNLFQIFWKYVCTSSVCSYCIYQVLIWFLVKVFLATKYTSVSMQQTYRHTNRNGNSCIPPLNFVFGGMKL